MPDPEPLDELRAELRRLYQAAPRGVWIAPGDQAIRGGVVAVDAEGRRSHIGAFFYGESAAQLVAAARNALPVLFRAIDDARAARSVPVLGTVGADGAVAWRGSPPGPVAASA